MDLQCFAHSTVVFLAALVYVACTPAPPPEEHETSSSHLSEGDHHEADDDSPTTASAAADATGEDDSLDRCRTLCAWWDACHMTPGDLEDYISPLECLESCEKASVDARRRLDSCYTVDTACLSAASCIDSFRREVEGG